MVVRAPAGQLIAPSARDCFLVRARLAVPIVVVAAALAVKTTWQIGAVACVAVAGTLLLAIADTRVSVHVDAAGVLAENRWSTARVPWQVAGTVELALPEPGTRGRARADLTTRSGERVPLDVVVVGATRASAAALAAWLVEEVEGRRREGTGAGYFEVERPWGRITLRVAGIALTVAPLVVAVVLRVLWSDVVGVPGLW